jgi:hypothetical protein
VRSTFAKLFAHVLLVV